MSEHPSTDIASTARTHAPTHTHTHAHTHAHTYKLAVVPVSFLDKHDVEDLIVRDHKVQATNTELISLEPVHKLIHCISSTPTCTCMN